MSKKIFPSDYSDEELKDKIRQLGGVLEFNDFNFTIRHAAVISVAQGELQTRQTIKIHDAAKSNEKSAKIFSYWSLGIAILSIFITIFITVLSLQSSDRWERKQLALLEKLHETSTAQAKLSNRILKLEQDKLIQS